MPEDTRPVIQRPVTNVLMQIGLGTQFLPLFFAKLRVGSGISYMLNYSPVSMGSALPLVIQIYFPLTLYGAVLE